MFQDFIDTIDSETSKDRRENSFGTALVRFQDLDFDLFSSKDDGNNVKRLEKIFENGGCSQYKPENRIPALIEREVLKKSMEISGLSENELLSTGEPPKLSLPPGCKLKCLQGRSRVRAAQSYLPTSKHWWAVELLSKGTACLVMPSELTDSTSRMWTWLTESTDETAISRADI